VHERDVAFRKRPESLLPDGTGDVTEDKVTCCPGGGIVQLTEDFYYIGSYSGISVTEMMDERPDRNHIRTGNILPSLGGSKEIHPSLRIWRSPAVLFEGESSTVPDILVRFAQGGDQPVLGSRITDLS